MAASIPAEDLGLTVGAWSPRGHRWLSGKRYRCDRLEYRYEGGAGGRHPSGLNRSSRQTSKSNRYAPRIRRVLPVDSSTGIVGSPRRVPLGLRFSAVPRRGIPRSSLSNRTFPRHPRRWLFDFGTARWERVGGLDHVVAKAGYVRHLVRFAMSRRSLRARAEVNYDTHDQNMGSKTPAWLKVRPETKRKDGAKERCVADPWNEPDGTTRLACFGAPGGGTERCRARSGSRRRQRGSHVLLGRKKPHLKR